MHLMNTIAYKPKTVVSKTSASWQTEVVLCYVVLILVSPYMDF